MPSLELKVPPPVVVLLLGGAMWGIASLAPSIALPAWLRWSAAIAIASAGAACELAGGWCFSRARTTINPMRPQASSALVSGGIYRFTRNPMYVGLLLITVAWAVFLSSAWALLGPPAFFFYIGRFQIVPEERVLAQRFGAAYAAYQARVPRWL